MKQKDPTDAELVAETLNGNRESFGRLYDRYARLVRAVVSGVSLDWSAVEDMTQESFLRAFRTLSKLRDRDRFGGWIVGIARHVARERKRSLRRERNEFIGESSPGISLPVDGLSEIMETEQVELVMLKARMLPERERVAIHAFYLQDRNAQQVAELLKLSQSGFYALLKRALANLKALVLSHEEEAKR